MRKRFIAAMLAASVALPAVAQTNGGVATPYRVPNTFESNGGFSTPSRPPTTGEVNQGAPTLTGGFSNDSTACCAAGVAPQVRPAVPTRRAGGAGASNPFSLFMCLPTYGNKTLESGGGPGANPNTCVWKGPVKTRQCDCSTYYYRETHTQTGPGGGASDGEEAYNGSQCVSFVTSSIYVCPGFNSCYTYTYNTCPGATAS